MRRPLLFSLLIVGSSLGLRAQPSPRDQFQLHLQSWQAAEGNHAPANLRYLEQVIREFGTIAYRDDDRLRGRAEALLRGIATRGGVPQTYRLRVAALETLARFARGKKSVGLFRKLATSRHRDFEDLDFWIGRAIGSAQEPLFLERLIAKGLRAKKELRRALLMGFSCLERKELIEVARKQLPALLDQARAKDRLVRYHAIRALAHLGLSEAFEAIAQCGRSRDPLLRQGAAWALGRLAEDRRKNSKAEDHPIFKSLETLLEDPVARIREEAIRGFGRSGEIRCVPLLLSRLEKEPMRVRATLYDALEKLSGKRIERQAEPWRSWWNITKKRLLAGSKGGKETPSEKLRGGRGASKGYEISYYGLPVLSDRLVFVLDISGSMSWGGELDKRPRITVAKEELLKVLDHLGPTTRFSIIAFSGSNILFHPKGLVPANKSWLRKARRFVERLSPGGGTNTWGAIETVLTRYKEADTIYLLSDGSPTLGRCRVQGQIIAKLVKLNRELGIRIHTIALLKGTPPNPSFAAMDDKEDAARFMKLIAELSHGSFVRVKD